LFLFLLPKTSRCGESDWRRLPHRHGLLEDAVQLLVKLGPLESRRVAGSERDSAIVLTVARTVRIPGLPMDPTAAVNKSTIALKLRALVIGAHR
jgi:hypothetical protein